MSDISPRAQLPQVPFSLVRYASNQTTSVQYRFFRIFSSEILPSSRLGVIEHNQLGGPAAPIGYPFRAQRATNALCAGFLNRAQRATNALCAGFFNRAQRATNALCAGFLNRAQRATNALCAGFLNRAQRATNALCARYFRLPARLNPIGPRNQWPPERSALLPMAIAA